MNKQKKQEKRTLLENQLGTFQWARCKFELRQKKKKTTKDSGDAVYEIKREREREKVTVRQ